MESLRAEIRTSDHGYWILDAGHWILDPGYSMLDTLLPWMLETRTKKSAEGIFSHPGEIMVRKSFHRAGRGAVNAEKEIRNNGMVEGWGRRILATGS